MGKNFGKRADHDQPRVQRDNIGLGFILALLASFLIVGFVTFMFAGGVKFENVKRSVTDLFSHQPNTYQSIAATCEKDWVPRAQNDPQLVCLLTTNIERLCKPEERAHLAYLYDKYAADRDNYKFDVAKRAVRISADMQGLQAELTAATRKNFENIQANIEGRTTVVNGDEMERVIKKMKQAVLGGPDGERAENVKRVPDEQISMAIRNLAEQGYITKWDFGWFPDALISAGFSDVTIIKDNCKK
jgi:hypothetical protein